MSRSLIAALLCFLLAGACGDNFTGSRIEANLSPGGVEVILPTPGFAPGDPEFFSHYEMHARIEGGGTVRLLNFQIQPSIYPEHPCLQYEEDIYCVDSDGFSCAPYINMQRFRELERLLVAVRVPFTVDQDGDGTWEHWPSYAFMDRDRFPPSLFVDPNEPDAELALHRDNLVEDEVRRFCAEALPADYYLGNVNQLTLPRSGDLFGAIDGPDPRTGITVGGLTLIVPAKLHRMTELFITRERDPKRLRDPETIDASDPEPGVHYDGQLTPGAGSDVFLIAQEAGPYGFIETDAFRGVITVFMENPFGMPVTLRAAVYADLDEDPITF